MKICWDNLEGVHLTKSGTFRKNSVTYIYKESCVKCGESYLAEKRRQSEFCSHSCAMVGRTHPMYGKSYKWITVKTGLTRYDTYKDKIGIYEDIRKQEGTEVLEVRCAYCGRWYSPTYSDVKSRLRAINNLNMGERRLYCSENCKLACPTYGQIKYPKGFKHITSREVNPYLRQMVLERDNWTCQICGKTIKEAQLHVHHMDPVTQNPMFQNDMGSCITLCEGCHKMVHKQHGCRYVDLRCKKVDQYKEDTDALRGMHKEKSSKGAK